tara:strand:- start:8681 stop:10057 length:1377 start_codon:yes stop_codon:yes gene_type:complete
MTTREFIQVNPTNLGDGKFSDRSGLNQIIFDIPRVPKIMNGKSLRVSGQFKILAGDGTTLPLNSSNFFANPAVRDFFIDGRTGVHSCIETLSIQSLNGATYSTIKSYNRLCASLLPLNDSINTYLNGNDSGMGGLGKDVSTAKKVDRPFDFAIPLLDGFLQGQPVDLMLVQGLRIVITLANSNYVVNNNKWRNSVSTSAKSDGGAFYEISDVICSFEAECPTPEGAEAMSKNRNGVMEYNTYSSFYNVLNSDDHNISLNINTGRTLAVIANIIPSSWVSNYDYNSQRTTQVLTANGAGNLENRVILKEITFTKGGMRLPLDFEIESEETEDIGIADSFMNWEEVNAIRDTWSVGNLVKSLQTELSNPYQRNGSAGITLARFDRANQPALVDEDKVQQFNMGFSTDKITDNGTNYKGTPLGVRIQHNLQGKVLVPHSLYLFVKHKNTIMFQNGMVNVMN